MHIKFNYPHKIRNDFLHDVVKDLVRQRHRLGITQDELNHTLGMADRLVSHWECGVRSPTAFHLYCWADALKGKILFSSNEDLNAPILKQPSNDNFCIYKTSVNDNILVVPEQKIKRIS